MVTFPYINESIQRSLDQVLAAYFDTGGSRVLNGLTMDFTACELGYQIDLIREEYTKPKILLVGSRSTVKEYHCTDPRGVKPMGVQRQDECVRTVYVTAPRTMQLDIDPPRQVDSLDMDRIWAQLHAVFTHWSAWSPQSIYRSVLDPVPTTVKEKDYLILFGTLHFQVRYAFAH